MAEFSIRPILNEETKEYSLLHFDEVRLACQNFIDENSISEVTGEKDLKVLRKCRTIIRKKSELIKKTRLSIIKLFSWQFAELEKMLNDADYKLKTIKDNYEAAKSEPTNAVKDCEEVLLKIKYRDVDVIDEIKKLAVEKGCTVTEIKEEK